MNTNLFYILTSPGFAAEFDKAQSEVEAEHGLFVSPADHRSIHRRLYGIDPAAELGDDAE